MPPKYAPTRQRKHKIQARSHRLDDHLPDSNEAIISGSKSKQETQRERLKNEIRAENSHASSKKLKRLDKYIENKLKKEENLELIKKLANEKDRHNTTGLLSSKNLRKRGFAEYVEGQKTHSFEHQTSSHQGNMARKQFQQASDGESEDSFEEHSNNVSHEHNEYSCDSLSVEQKAVPPQGTGLAQPLQIGSDGLPIIPERSSKKRAKSLSNKQVLELLDMLSDEDESADEDEDDDLSDGYLPRGEAVAELSSDEESETSSSWSGFSDSGQTSVGSDDENEVTTELKPLDFNTGLKNSHEKDVNQESGGESDQASHDSPSEDSDAGRKSGTDFESKSSAFKIWATKQLNRAMGHVPSYEHGLSGEHMSLVKQPRAKPSASDISDQIPPVDNKPNRRAYTIHVERPASIEESRQRLPILQREQEIMEAIHNNPVVIVKGDTGSGKTTQVPQFLYEAGYGDRIGPTPGLIGITQPRRVAAVSMAKRVADELGTHGTRVAHQIRFDSSVSINTAIKFMTDGVLLRELSQDLLLKKYSVVIIDEAHERSVNSDILIGMLSKIVPARLRKTAFNPDPKPLKVVIMSATLNIGDFLSERLFSPGTEPPIVEAEGRQHKVTTHFALRSRRDYLEEVVEKVKRAHRKLPKGGILVFLTGQNEIVQVSNRLKRELSTSKTTQQTSGMRMHLASAELPLELDDMDVIADMDAENDQLEDDDIDILTDEEVADKEFEISDNENHRDTAENGEKGILMSNPRNDVYDSVHILPLYSQLPTAEQLRVFEAPPERSRLIVLSTNVAETSLTIPGIRFVFDCGRSKERRYNLNTGVQSFEIDYISKASAQQRAGRAGRTGPGHCWRLYSSAVFEQFFPEHADPEILRMPAETIVLQLKSFRYPKSVTEFPFPTPPDHHVLDKAETLLKNLGVLSPLTGAMTETGKQLATYPLPPRLGKILTKVLSNTSILNPTIALVGALAVGEVFIQQSQIFTTPDVEEGDDDKERLRQEYGRANASLSRFDKASDAMKLLTAVNMYMEASNKESFCKQYFLRSKAMREIHQLADQLRRLVQANQPSLFPLTKEKSKLSSSQVRSVNIAASSGYIDQVAIRWDLAPNAPELPSKPRKAIDVPYLPLTPLKSGPNTSLVEVAIFIHPTSVLSRINVKDLPPYIVYTHLQQSQTATVGDEKISRARMFPLTSLDANELLSVIRETSLVDYGKPVQKTKIEELGGNPKRRICWVTTEVRGGHSGSFAWPMPPSRVEQVMDLKAPTGWRVDKVLA